MTLMEDRLQKMRALVESEPDDPLTRFLLGRAAAEMGLYEESCSAFQAACSLDPRYAAAFRQWGDALDKLGRHAEAANVYARGARVAEQTGDLQAGKEMKALLKRLERDHGVKPGAE
jgi:uncharacterized protein HemY